MGEIKPNSMGVKILFLVFREMPTIHIMQPPDIPICFFLASEITKTQARFSPPHVLLGSMDLLQNESLGELGHQIFATKPFSLKLPQRHAFCNGAS